MGSGRHHQFGSSVKKVYHIRLSAKRHHIVHGKGICLATVFITHGRGTFTLIELELHLLLHRNNHLIDFSHCRMTAPERNNIVELSTHRRNEFGIIFLCSSQQCISETFLCYLIINNIAGLQSTNFKHNLTRPPINGTCRSSIIAGLCHIKVFHFSVCTVDSHPFKLGMGCERVIVILNNPIGYGSFRSLYFYYFTYGKRALSGRLDRHQCTVQQSHAIGLFISLSLQPLHKFSSLERMH